LAVDTTAKSGINWLGFVNNYVNKPLGITSALNGLTLDSSRNPWAQDVDLLLPGVMQTSEVALGSYSLAPLTSAVATVGRPRLLRSPASCTSPRFP
jgi:hypothetical protein